MKKLALIISVVLMLNILPLAVSAQELVTVKLNGAELDFDVPAQIINDRTLVPLRAIFEMLGATVEWDDATQTVTAYRGNTSISLQIGSRSMFVNRVEKVLDVPAQLVDSRTLVPARAVAESFGATVDWDDATDTVLITDNTIYNYGALLNTALTIPDPTSVNAQLDMFASVRMNANEINTAVNADVIMTADPTALKADVSMADGHNGVDAHLYALEEAGVPTLYMVAKVGHEEESVQKSTVDSVWSVANYHLLTGRMYYTMSESIKVIGEEDNCVKYLVTITGENIKALVKESKAGAILPTDTGLDIVLDNIKATDTLDITMWIDKDLAQPVKTAWDLAPLMNKHFASIGMDTGAVASKFTYEIKVNSFNDAQPVSVPEEVK